LIIPRTTGGLIHSGAFAGLHSSNAAPRRTSHKFADLIEALMVAYHYYTLFQNN
jgi:hypothetical protein